MVFRSFFDNLFHNQWEDQIVIDTLKRATPESLVAIEEEKLIRGTGDVFLIFANGSQFDHLIYQRMAKRGVYCLVADPASVTVEDVKKVAPIGIVLSGGPMSVHGEPPPFDERIFDLGIPVLGICLGFQMWAKYTGVAVMPGEAGEFSTHTLEVNSKSDLFRDCQSATPVLHSHRDHVAFDATQLRIIGTTSGQGVAAAQSWKAPHLWGVQFHPEVPETEEGDQMFENFCFRICGAKDRFQAGSVATKKIAHLRTQLAGKKGILLLSGGSDSSVVAHLLKEAFDGEPGHIRGVYIKGLDRPDDEAYARKYFGDVPWLEFVVVDATDRFLEALAGKTKMRDKRRGMKEVYREIGEQQIADFGAEFIAQGTLYTDLSESGKGHQSGARRATIKEHHNDVEFSVEKIEPLSDCVKDGARDIGREIGVPEDLLIRHPFPGPGLAIRVEGEITRERLLLDRKLDGIWIEELRRANLYHTVWQAGANLTAGEHTTSRGDDAGSGPIVMYWAVWSVNGFTARAAELPWPFLKQVSRRFGNEVPEIGTATYRTSDKPPSTIEQG